MGSVVKRLTDHLGRGPGLLPFSGGGSPNASRARARAGKRKQKPKGGQLPKAKKRVLTLKRRRRMLVDCKWKAVA